jgi:ubiquinone/menaquinone biosynthesis C-methylase UbiE
VNFDRVAPHYRWLEGLAFGNVLQRARVAWLTEIGTPVRVLLMGEGNGKFLSELLKMYPEVKVDCVDASARMLQLTEERVRREIGGSKQGLRLLHEDLWTWSPEPNAYELIVTHFVLDCFRENEIERIVAKLAGAARRNAFWLLADFAIPTRGMARLHAQLWLRAMYWFFRATTRISSRELIDPSELLRTHDFRLVGQTVTRFGLIKSELWQRETWP